MCFHTLKKTRVSTRDSTITENTFPKNEGSPGARSSSRFLPHSPSHLPPLPLERDRSHGVLRGCSTRDHLRDHDSARRAGQAAAAGAGCQQAHRHRRRCKGITGCEVRVPKEQGVLSWHGHRPTSSDTSPPRLPTSPSKINTSGSSRVVWTTEPSSALLCRASGIRWCRWGHIPVFCVSSGFCSYPSGS